MKISSSKFLILLNLLGSLIVMTSSSWVMVWVGIEMSTMSIPPLLMMSNNSIISKINAWKYYMVQCYSSSIFLLSILCLSYSSQYWTPSNIQWALIFFSMILKMGVLPFHGWMFHLSNSLEWFQFMILSTIQKIGPLVIIGEVWKPLSIHMSIDLMMSASLSIILISTIMINSIRYFMLVSSIINIMWMISASQVSKYSFLVFMSFYFIHLFILFNFLFNQSSNKLDSMLFNSKKSFYNEMLKMTIILSMIGIPPLAGFFTKMMVIENLINLSQIQTSLILTLSSSIIMIIYLSMISINILNMQVSMSQFNMSHSLSLSLILLMSIVLFL